MMTSMCVDATTRAGADLGFKITLARRLRRSRPRVRRGRGSCPGRPRVLRGRPWPVLRHRHARRPTHLTAPGDNNGTPPDCASRSVVASQGRFRFKAQAVAEGRTGESIPPAPEPGWYGGSQPLRSASSFATRFSLRVSGARHRAPTVRRGARKGQAPLAIHVSAARPAWQSDRSGTSRPPQKVLGATLRPQTHAPQATVASRRER